MADEYWPGVDAEWERREPGEVGIDGEGLKAAIDYALDPRHAGSPKDLAAHLLNQNGGLKYDDGKTLGPTKSHGGVTGVVLRHGYLVAEWGNPERVDMTFSVSKSFLSTVAGVMWDRGMLGDLNDPVGKLVDDGGYASEHNGQITWDHSLRQISEWDGTLWEKPYAAGSPDDTLREPVTPGTRYEYNDVRVNRFALSLLRVLKEPLPELLKREVMDPIGATDTWIWNGYDNSYVEIDGKRIQSVSGGGHWGGGMWISARDQARFGHLSLRRGAWDGKQILSDAWVKMALTPTALRPTYGFMNWFLNTDHALMPSAPENHFYHGGAGTNRIWVAPELDLVVVLRWVSGEHYDGFVQRILAAVDP